MSKRKLIGAVMFGLLILLGWASRHVSGFSQDNWGIPVRLAYSAAVAAALLATFYDRKNLPKKTWDFKPKRGLLYFVLGWIIFPIMFGINAALGDNLTLGGMLLGTLALSAFIGIVGIFTENVGI